MRDESVFLIGVGVFFGIVGLIYWLTAYEDAGGVLLLGTCFLGLVPGLWSLAYPIAAGHDRHNGSRRTYRARATVRCATATRRSAGKAN